MNKYCTFFTSVFLTCLCVRNGLFVEATEEIKLAAFNIQIFGKTKETHSAVMDVIVSTALRYDMLYIEELKEKPINNLCGPNTGPAICALQSILNQASSEPYNLAVSNRVGDASPEQYVLLYKESKVELVSEFIWADEFNQIVRPPWITEIKVKNTDFTFHVTQIHTNPDHAKQEIYALTNVSKSIDSEYQILLGDFNSDGDYFHEQRDWPFFFEQLPGYLNAITDDMDTTVHVQSNTYDRIVLSPKMQELYDPDSPKPFYYDKIEEGGFSMDPIKYQGCQEGYISKGCTDNVTDNIAALEVSDHYPVEILLRFPNKK